MKEPGLQRSLLGDGLANILSGFFGATPNTTYGENIGVLAITRCFSVWVIGGAAVLAMIISFVGKVAALIHAIPVTSYGWCIYSLVRYHCSIRFAHACRTQGRLYKSC